MLQPLSDMMAQPLAEGEQVFLERLQSQTDVLVVNWDAINDDPDFGPTALCSGFGTDVRFFAGG